MNKLIIFLFPMAFILSGCLGYTSKNNELVGQPKKILSETPVICPDFKSIDISLGVMKNGVGSMSTQDMWLLVEDETLVPKLKSVIASGSIIKIIYDERRVTYCVPAGVLRTFEIVK